MVRPMEIIPGVGVSSARIGDRREDIEGRLGSPTFGPRGRKSIYAGDPGLVVWYAAGGIAEAIEIGYEGEGGEGVFLQGVQLTGRLLDDVVAELVAKGYT